MDDVGRNDPCPCGSGKKYKKCCLETHRQAMLRERQESLAPNDLQPEPLTAESQEWTDERPEDSEELELTPEAKAFWDAAYPRILEAGTFQEQVSACIRAVDEAPSFRADDGTEFLNILIPGVEDASTATPVLELLDAWRLRFPEAYLACEPDLALLRTELAFRFQVGDLCQAVLDAAVMGIEAPQEFEAGVLEVLAWRGETNLLIQGILAAWPAYLEQSEELGDELLLYFAYFSIRMLLVAEQQGIAQVGQHEQLLRQMALTMAPAEEVDAFLLNQRQITGPTAPGTVIPVAAAVQRSAQLDPAVLEHLRFACNQLRTLYEWPETRIELARIAWVGVLRQVWRSSVRLQEGVPLWRKLTPTAKSMGRWREQWVSGPGPKFYRVAAWMASLPIWIDLVLADAPVPRQVAKGWAGLVHSLARPMKLFLAHRGDDSRQSLEGLEKLRHWAESRTEPSTQSLAFLSDEQVQQLVQAGTRVPESLWRTLVQRGPEVLPSLHDLMRHVALEDAVPTAGPELALYQSGIHAAFICAAIGDPSSVPHILDLAATSASNDEGLQLGLTWFPLAFGPLAVDRFLEFVKDGHAAANCRCDVAKGVVWLAGQFPELRETVATALVEVMDQLSDTYLTSLMIHPLLTTGDVRAVKSVEKAYERDQVDQYFFGDFGAARSRHSQSDWFLSDPPEFLTAEQYFLELSPPPAASKSTKGSQPKSKSAGKAKKSRK